MKTQQIEFKNFAPEAKARAFPLTSVSVTPSGVTASFLKSVPERNLVDHYTVQITPRAGSGTWRKLSPLLDEQGSGAVENVEIAEDATTHVVLKGIWVESGIRTQMAICAPKPATCA